MLKTICYISDLDAEESFSNLKDIYSKAKRNNFNNNITGILIYNKRNFLQVFEGEKKIVDETFKRIKKNPKHKNIFTIVDVPTEYRYFDEYNYGFCLIKDKDTLKDLRNYLEWLKEAENKVANKIILLIENFISKSI